MQSSPYRYTHDCRSMHHVHSGGGESITCYTCKSVAEGYKGEKEAPYVHPLDRGRGFTPQPPSVPTAEELGFECNRPIVSIASINNRLYIAIGPSLYEMQGHDNRLRHIAGPKDFNEADKRYTEGRTA